MQSVGVVHEQHASGIRHGFVVEIDQKRCVGGGVFLQLVAETRTSVVLGVVVLG